MARDTYPRMGDTDNVLLQKIAYQLVTGSSGGGAAVEGTTTSIVLLNETDGVTEEIKLYFNAGHFYVRDLNLLQNFVDFDRASGQLNLGFAGSRIALNADDVIPATTATTNLGSALVKFLGAHFSGTVSAGAFSGALTGAASSNVLKAGDTMTGNLLFSTDNTRDIGASGATRPRTIYVGTSVVSPTFTGNLTGTVTGTATLDLQKAGGMMTGGIIFSGDNTLDIGVAGATRPRTIYVGTSVVSPLFTGNLTGNVTGAVTGAASSNVLKAGDTMTGNLLFSADNTHNIGASGATRPARVYVANEVVCPTFTGSLAGSATGNVGLTGGTMTGALLFSTDNSIDIGANGATRPRTVYVGTSVVIGGVAAATVDTHSTLTYAGSTAIDFTSDDYRTITLTGNITFTTSNRAAARSVTLKIIGDSSSRTFTFPAWKFVGSAAPASIAANKIAILTLTCFGSADTDIVAAYAEEP